MPPAAGRQPALPRGSSSSALLVAQSFLEGVIWSGKFDSLPSWATGSVEILPCSAQAAPSRDLSPYAQPSGMDPMPYFIVTLQRQAEMQRPDKMQALGQVEGTRAWRKRQKP